MSEKKTETPEKTEHTGTPTPEGMITAEPRITSALIEGIIAEIDK